MKENNPRLPYSCPHLLFWVTGRTLEGCARARTFLKFLSLSFSLNQVLSNIDDLFEREELSAAPDPGWPDCFNSGVFVYQPSIETYNQLLHLASEQGSFDGKYLLSCI